MRQRPFHHGNLRAALLERAEAVLRERGVEALSLRELARDAGVSHGAPRSHFIDRAALLEALAERGFDRVAHAIAAAAAAAPVGAEHGSERLRAAGAAYLDFAAGDPALLTLMATAKADAAAGPVHDAAARLFAAMTAVVTTAIGHRIDDPAVIARLTLLLSATLQGISAMVGSGRIPAAMGDTLLDDAIGVFLSGTLGAPPSQPRRACPPA